MSEIGGGKEVRTYIASSVFVGTWEDDGDLDVASGETEFVPGLEHATAVVEVVVVERGERSGGV